MAKRLNWDRCHEYRITHKPSVTQYVFAFTVKWGTLCAACDRPVKVGQRAYYSHAREVFCARCGERRRVRA